MQMIFLLDASTIQFVQLQNANHILCWMLQLIEYTQLQNTNDNLTGNNYKMNANTKRLAQLHFFVQNDPWLAICTVAQVLPFM
jgi:hypothetical protein